MINIELLKGLDADYTELKKSGCEGEEEYHYHGYLAGYKAGRAKGLEKAAERAMAWLKMSGDKSFPSKEALYEDLCKVIREGKI